MQHRKFVCTAIERFPHEASRGDTCNALVSFGDHGSLQIRDLRDLERLEVGTAYFVAFLRAD